jgi:hypothetical protein
MRRLFVVLVLLVIGVGVLGWYRGWFTFDWESSNGKGQVTGTVDQDKIRQDRERAAEKVRDLGNQAATATEKARGQSTKE